MGKGEPGKYSPPGTDNETGVGLGTDQRTMTGGFLFLPQHFGNQRVSTPQPRHETDGGGPLRDGCRVCDTSWNRHPRGFLDRGYLRIAALDLDPGVQAMCEVLAILGAELVGSLEARLPNELRWSLVSNIQDGMGFKGFALPSLEIS